MVKKLTRKEAVLVNQYLKLIADRKLTDARRNLEVLRQTLADKEWRKGYYHALQGMSLALRSRDPRYVYISQINSAGDPKDFDVVRRKLLEQSRNSLQKDFDKGFFTAWSDYLKILKMARQ